MKSVDRFYLVLGLMLLAALGVGTLLGGKDQAAAGAATSLAELRGSPEEARRFIGYDRSIRLTAAQQSVMQEALGAIPAPCCSSFSAATCCCECNMARSLWGLSKHLIAEQGAGVEEVRATARAWTQAINPAGFTGDACFTGGCTRAFRHNGCGGMEEAQLVD